MEETVSEESSTFRNVDVRTSSGQELIDAVVRRRRLELFGHIARMDDDIRPAFVARLTSQTLLLASTGYVHPSESSLRWLSSSTKLFMVSVLSCPTCCVVLLTCHHEVVSGLVG